MSIREKRMFEVEKMTLDSQDLDEFVTSKDIDRDRLKMAFVAGGQGGGKIASEFCRLGYPLVAYNTCKEDLDDLEEKISSMSSRGPFERIDLNSMGGASKDRDLGLKAIRDSLPILKDSLLVNKDLQDANFVWIVVALGGGTGNGSLTSVAKMLSTYVRNKKKVYRSGKWYPTIGVIAAIPDQSAKSKIRINVAKAIEELESLQASGDIGSVILLDNQKLIDDFRKNYDPDKDGDKTWTTDGNNKVARILTELALSTSLKGSEMLDVTEMLDIWSTPGFLSVGKKELADVWMVERCIEKQEEDLPLPQDTEKNRELMGEMLKKSFTEGIFVGATDLQTAVHGGMVVITDGKLVTNKDSKDLEDALTMKILDSDAIETPHYGFVKTELTGTVKEPAATNGGVGKVFTMCVTKGAPKYIVKWFEDAIKSKEDHVKALESISKNSLQGFSSKISEINSTNNDTGREEINLGDLFGSVSGVDFMTQERESNLDDLDQLFASISDLGGKKEENTIEKQNNSLDELFNM